MKRFKNRPRRGFGDPCGHTVASSSPNDIRSHESGTGCARSRGTDPPKRSPYLNERRCPPGSHPSSTSSHLSILASPIDGHVSFAARLDSRHPNVATDGRIASQHPPALGSPTSRRIGHPQYLGTGRSRRPTYFIHKKEESVSHFRAKKLS